MQLVDYLILAAFFLLVALLDRAGLHLSALDPLVLGVLFVFLALGRVVARGKPSLGA